MGKYQAPTVAFTVVKRGSLNLPGGQFRIPKRNPELQYSGLLLRHLI